MKKQLLFLFVIAIAFLGAQTPDWQWVESAGGTSNDVVKEIAADAFDNIYVTGDFEGTANFGSNSVTSFGESDIFIAKIDASGIWQWALHAGSFNDDKGYDIVSDDSGNTYVTGYFRETATFGPFSLICDGWYDVFIAKIDPEGNWLWVTRAGGDSSDFGNGITLDINNNCLITGSFIDSASFGTICLQSSGVKDFFIAKLDMDGNWLWASQAGGENNDKGLGIVVDGDNNYYTFGTFEGTAAFGNDTITSEGLEDIFIYKTDSNGNSIWVEQAGGSYEDICLDIDVDSDNNIYIIGSYTNVSNFGPYLKTSNGNSDIFTAKLDSSGDWLWVSSAGGVNGDEGYGVSVSNSCNCYITGVCQNVVTFGSQTLPSIGNMDIFISKLDLAGDWFWTLRVGSDSSDFGRDLLVDDNEELIVTGMFKEYIPLGLDTLYCVGENDIYIANLCYSVAAEQVIQSSSHTYYLSNYPNPFNPSTTISYTVAHSLSSVQLEIYNIKGQLVKDLSTSLCHAEPVEVRGEKRYSIVWDGTNLNNQPVSSGIYYSKLKINGKEAAVNKMLLAK